MPLVTRKCWISHGLVVFILLLLLSLGQAANLTVTTTSDVVNGDVSNPDALKSNPGPDGISLREAILSVNNAAGPHTITFAPEVAGQTIAVTSPLVVTRDGVTLTGLSTPDGQPNITLDAGGITEGACSRALLFVHASDFTMTWFRVMRVTVTGIRIQAGQSFCTAPPPQVSNIRIEHNVFDNTGLNLTEFGKAVWVMTDPEGLATDARITNVTIARNSFLHYAPWPFGLGVLVGPSGRNCAIQDVVIHANTFADTLGGVEFSMTTGSGNRIVGTQITENIFRSGIVPVFIGNVEERPDVPPASGNVIDDTVVRANIFFGEFDSISIVGGQNYASANVVRDIEIINNLIVTGNGIHIVGGKWGATGNRVEGVRISNNSIVTHPLAGVRVFSDFEDGAENSVTGVSVLNTIFQKREPDTPRPEDVIAGEITPDQVRFSIISTPGFVGVNGNFSADPKFANPAQGDFHLQPGSPAIDAGTSDGAPSTDLECRTRFDDPLTPNTGEGTVRYYDIGAFEYGSPPTVRLTLTNEGTGNGTVTVDPTGNDCSVDNSPIYNIGTVVTLTPIPALGSVFAGWAGDSDCSDGVVTMTSNKTCIATFTALETVSIPNIPTGSSMGKTGISYSYTTGGSSSSPGHPVEYQFDWKGDGSDPSPWDSATQPKTWTTAGVYNVRARARCVQDVSVVSGWSNSLSVSISLPDISVTPTAYDFANVKVKRSKTASFKVKNNGKGDLSISTAIIGTNMPMFSIMSGAGSRKIKPGKTSTVKVVFKPTSTGSKQATLRITSNDPDTPIMDIFLSGTGQ